MKPHIAGLAALLVATAAPAFADMPHMTVHKDPNCGCCTAWADLARQAGYAVTQIENPDMSSIKQRLGVPDQLWSCHTVEVDGYVIEGHVPFDALARLLKERPPVTGIAVPGMPAGSPGMGDDPAAEYDVVAWGADAGEGHLYQRVGADR